MKLKDLNQAIRDQIGAEGPQFTNSAGYEERINDILETMTVGRLLEMLEYMEIE